VQLTDEQIKEVRSFVRENVCLSLVALCKSLSIISTEFDPVLFLSHYCELLNLPNTSICSTQPLIFHNKIWNDFQRNLKIYPPNFS